jgi:hypothetical protein
MNVVGSSTARVMESSLGRYPGSEKTVNEKVYIDKRKGTRKSESVMGKVDLFCVVSNAITNAPYASKNRADDIVNTLFVFIAIFNLVWVDKESGQKEDITKKLD